MLASLLRGLDWNLVLEELGRGDLDSDLRYLGRKGLRLAGVRFLEGPGDLVRDLSLGR